MEGIISVCVKFVKYLKVTGNEDGRDTQIQDKYSNLTIKPIELLTLPPSYSARTSRWNAPNAEGVMEYTWLVARKTSASAPFIRNLPPPYATHLQPEQSKPRSAARSGAQWPDVPIR